MKRRGFGFRAGDLRRAGYMLRGRSRWSELGSGAELLDWARTEFWHGNGEKPVFGARKPVATTRKFRDFPTLGSEREGRTTDTAG